MPTCAVLSFRLGGTDGVSVVASTWIDALRSEGFEVVTVAGEGPVDRLGRSVNTRRTTGRELTLPTRGLMWRSGSV